MERRKTSNRKAVGNSQNTKPASQDLLIKNGFKTVEADLASQLFEATQDTVLAVDSTLEQTLDALEPLKNGELIESMLRSKMLERGWQSDKEDREPTFFLSGISSLINSKLTASEVNPRYALEGSEAVSNGSTGSQPDSPTDHWVDIDV